MGGFDEAIQQRKILTDEEIVHTVTKDDVKENKDDDGSLTLLKISASEAANALNTAIKWAEEYVQNSEGIMLLRRLESINNME